MHKPVFTELWIVETLDNICTRSMYSLYNPVRPEWAFVETTDNTYTRPVYLLHKTLLLCLWLVRTDNSSGAYYSERHYNFMIQNLFVLTSQCCTIKSFYECEFFQFAFRIFPRSNLTYINKAIVDLKYSHVNSVRNSFADSGNSTTHEG